MFEQELFNDSSDTTPLPTEQSYKDVIQQAREGNASAFTELVHLFYTPVATYLARLVGNDELGRDLAQETFIRAWTSLTTLREEHYFKPWLYRIATNIARSHLRRARLIRWLPWSDMSETVVEDTLHVGGPEEQVSENDSINQTLARLSPQYRTCLLLQIVAGFSQRDIASMLGISEKSVGSNVSRGREQFRHIYQSLKGDIQ